ncbi:hypothetical protein D3C85_1425000 [compost metagenome]
MTELSHKPLYTLIGGFLFTCEVDLYLVLCKRFTEPGYPVSIEDSDHMPAAISLIVRQPLQQPVSGFLQSNLGQLGQFRPISNHIVSVYKENIPHLPHNEPIPDSCVCEESRT